MLVLDSNLVIQRTWFRHWHVGRWGGVTMACRLACVLGFAVATNGWSDPSSRPSSSRHLLFREDFESFSSQLPSISSISKQQTLPVVVVLVRITPTDRASPSTWPLSRHNQNKRLRPQNPSFRKLPAQSRGGAVQKVTGIKGQPGTAQADRTGLRAWLFTARMTRGPPHDRATRASGLVWQDGRR